MKIKHSKYKNTGILFELLSRQVTSDTIEGNFNYSLDIIRKFFKKGTQLHEEIQLYNLLTQTKYKDPKKADILLEAILSKRSKMDESKLKSEKYNLIKEIKNHYNLDNFFKAKISNYREQASIYNLFEIYNNANLNPSVLVEFKMNVLTSLLKEESKSTPNIFDEFKSYDKDVRLLSYQMVVESFNEKYAGLGVKQKNLLKAYINEVSNTPKLKQYVNKCVEEIKSDITGFENLVKDEAIKIKLNEVKNLLQPVTKSLKDSDINNILNYYELVRELKEIHG